MKGNFIVILLLALCIKNPVTAALPQRTEASLNGIWDFTPAGQAKTQIEVPDYWDTRAQFLTVKEATYERKVTIPASPEWKNKIIQLEFEGVNFITDVYIGEEKIASHAGGWIPFTVDITKYVSPGKSFDLKVVVKGGCFEPIVDSDGNPQWPVGFVGQERRWGIVFDVWLRAYGNTHFNDVYIQTSFRNKKIRVDYEVKNESAETKKILVKANIVPTVKPDSKELVLVSNPVTLKPGEKQVITIEKTWSNPTLWSPANPYLYYLQSEIVMSGSSGETTDRQNTRFGFREIWITGNKLMFNGHPFTILGTNVVQHSEFHDNQRYWFLSPEAWNSTIDRLFELDIRTVRFHMQPAPKYMLDVADERGLLVIDESTIYAREYVLKSNKAMYIENSKKWIEPWVKARRNHPAVIIWNAENEMGVGWLRWVTSEEMKSLGDEIRKYDKTRPVNYDGDRDVGDAMVNYHYLESYTGSPKGSVYSWADSVIKDKPTGVGEFITHYGPQGEENQWWQGTWVRGMRYVNFADIRPYRHDWAILRSDMDAKILNLKNGYSPVALFDKEYDDLGIDPLIRKNIPFLKCGDTLNRTLILYNDEFADTLIEVEVLIKSSDMYQALTNYTGERAPKQKIIAQGRKTYIVPLGRHFDIPYSFQVPKLAEGFVDRIDVEFIARKKGEVRFRETKSFNIRNMGFTANSSNIVVLGDLKLPQFK